MCKRRGLKMLFAIAGVVFLLGAALPTSSGETNSTSADEDPRGGKPPCCMLRDLSANFGCLGDSTPSNLYICVAFHAVTSMACGVDYVCPQ